MLGERVGLGVSLAPGVIATPESIIAEADKRLRYPARPVICVIFPDGIRAYSLHGRSTDTLATNANGKILKNEVKEVVVAQWKKQGGQPAGPAKARL